jgi:hypothetical protein
MVSDKIGYIWAPLFFALFLYEYNTHTINMCGSMTTAGQMWFMWLMMSLSSSGKWINLVEKKFRGFK